MAAGITYARPLKAGGSYSSGFSNGAGISSKEAPVKRQARLEDSKKIESSNQSRVSETKKREQAENSRRQENQKTLDSSRGQKIDFKA